MSNRRKEARKKRQRKAKLTPPVLDIHGEHLVDQLEDLEAIMGSILSADDPAASVQEQFDGVLRRFVDGASRFSAVSLIEAARMAVLPWTREGAYRVDPDASAAHVELLALIALAAEAQTGGRPPGEEPEVQAMSQFISQAKDDLDLLLSLSHVRAAMTVDKSDKLAFVAMLVRGSQVVIRNSSYADVAERTVTDLLDGAADVRAELAARLGFDAHDAIRVLTAVHEIQQDQVNDRGENFADALNAIRNMVEAASQGEGHEPDDLTDEVKVQLRARWLEALGTFFEPSLEASTVQ